MSGEVEERIYTAYPFFTLGVRRVDYVTSRLPSRLFTPQSLLFSHFVLLRRHI